MAAESLLPEELVKNWNTKWKDEGVVLFQNVFYNATADEQLQGGLEFRALLYDLMNHTVVGNVDVEDVESFFSELVSTLEISSIFPSLLADVLSVLDAEVSYDESKDQRSVFKTLAVSCSKHLGEPLLKERLDMDTLEVVGLVPSKSSFNQKYVKTKTKLFYKQQKFNLFREETEGYSKLISELGHEKRPEIAAPAMLDNIKCLIGRFNLDPNRVLDVILEAFESHLDEREFFIPLLQGYPCEASTFVNILGFKFQSHQDSELGKVPPTPSPLYKLTAVLLHDGLVELKDLYPHLSQSDEKLKEFHQSVIDDALTNARKATIVSLNEKTDEEIEKEKQIEQQKKTLREQLLSLEVNQKLGLCHALLELGDWSRASALMDLLPPSLPMWSSPIAKSLSRLVHLSLEPVYRGCCPKAAKGGSRPSSPSPASELLKPCLKVEELYPDVFQMLFHLGPHVHADPVLLAKLLRIGRAFLKERASTRYSDELPSQEKEDVFHSFISLTDEVLLPSLSLLPCNCGMAEETWAMVKQLPYETRYLLYGRWKNSSYDNHPELINVKTQILSRGRYIMKRLTKDNIKPSGRQIGKLSHSNPGIIFDYVLSQIQRYDNFIIPVVDSLKYLTPLAYDVLAYCIIEALGNPQKERLKHEDTNISNWLQGLASFCGNVFKKYPIELTGLLQYIANQLKAGKSFDLLVLKEVIQKMAGIDITEEVTSSQLEALAGGELLKAEGAYFSQVRNTKKSSQRLREALVNANLSLPLLLLMSQQRDCIVYRDGAKRHLKLVGTLFDNCLDTLVQFGGFLSTHLSPEEYRSRVPKLNELGLEYHIPADVAFFVLRPSIHHAISTRFSELEKAAKSDADKDKDKKAKASRQEANYLTACLEVIDPLVEAAKQLHSSKVWDDMNCRLYAIFWSLSLYDLYVPTKRYEDEISKAKQAIKELEDSQDMTMSKRKKEQERNSVLIEKLQEERQRQEDNNRLVTSWIKQEKDTWFNPRVTKNRTITQFLQLCVYPRCRFTASDALYCAKFVCLLHTVHTPNFSTLLFFDRIFSDISYTVACCTENEARRYGRFLGALLETITRWHTSESSYGRECVKTPGFISMMRSSGSVNEKQYLDYENYRHITFKWHFKLTKSLVILLESKDYMQVRNGLIVLTKMLPYYPKVYHLSIALEKRIEKIIEEEKEKRPDLYALAIGYAGMLKGHKQNLIPENEFHIREERVKAQQSDAKEKEKDDDKLLSSSTKSDETKTPRPKSSSAKVDESKPSSSSVSMESSSKPKGGGSSTPSSKEREAKVTEGSKEKGNSNSHSAESAKVNGDKREKAKEATKSAGKSQEMKEDKVSSQSSDSCWEVAPSSNTDGDQSVSASPATSGGCRATRARVSPLVHNGPVGGVSPRVGQRRQQVESPDPSIERETKRRKVEEDTSKSKTDVKLAETQKTVTPSLSSSQDKKEKGRLERKRERSSEKDLSDSKRRKDSPDTITSSKDGEPKEKKRVLKVNKRESKTPEESSVSAKKAATGREDDKTKKHTKVRAMKK